MNETIKCKVLRQCRLPVEGKPGKTVFRVGDIYECSERDFRIFSSGGYIAVDDAKPKPEPEAAPKKRRGRPPKKKAEDASE